MAVYHYEYQNHTWELPVITIPPDSLLETYHKNDCTLMTFTGLFEGFEAASVHRVLTHLLDKESSLEIADIDLLEYLQIPSYWTYIIATLREREMKQHFLDESYPDRGWRIDPFYDLIVDDPDEYRKRKIERLPDSKGLLRCGSSSPAPRNSQMGTNNNELVSLSLKLLTGDDTIYPRSLIFSFRKTLEHLFTLIDQIPEAFITGQAPFSCFSNYISVSIDVFIVTEDEDRARKVLREIYDILCKERMEGCIIKEYSVEIHCNSTRVEVFLMLFRSYSEVLHTIDVDCCALGYKNGNFWLTPRAFYALLHGCNTVNLDKITENGLSRVS